MASDTDPGMVAIISARLKSKSLLRNEIHSDFEKTSNASKMASHQNEKCVIGISMVENPRQGNYSPSP